jgi:CRISPR-associated protein Csx14
MQKISIIAPVGTSPPVVTEFLQYVQEAMSERATDLTLIATREPLVLSGVELIKAAVRRRYPHVHTHVVELPFTDITSDREHLEFMKVCARVIRDQREAYGADRVYLCVAGGRKDMCITMALLGQYLGVNGVFHVVMPDVKAFNVELERARAAIEELAKAEDKDAYYRERAELFDPLMYPPLSSYSVITIPVLPVPRDLVREAVRILKAKKLRLDEVKAPLDFLKAMEAANLVKVTQNYVYTKKLGYDVLDVLGELV